MKEGTEDEDEIVWGRSFSAKDHVEAARRCLAKHRHIDPKGLSNARLKHLLRELKGYDESAVSESNFSCVIEEWIVLHEIEIEKVTFDNVANYEP